MNGECCVDWSARETTARRFPRNPWHNDGVPLFFIMRRTRTFISNITNASSDKRHGGQLSSDDRIKGDTKKRARSVDGPWAPRTLNRVTASVNRDIDINYWCLQADIAWHSECWKLIKCNVQFPTAINLFDSTSPMRWLRYEWTGKLARIYGV